MLEAAALDPSFYDEAHYFEENDRNKVDTNKKKISFGTTLDRGLFPHVCASDRTGNHLNPVRGAPHLGPGCYNNAEVTSFTYDLDQWICSKRGYTYNSRTDSRFHKVHQTVNSPSPAAYQMNWMSYATPKPNYKPFGVSDVRFKQIMQDPMITPGPGTYQHDVRRYRQVQWPQKFNAPIKPIQPDVARRTLKTELMDEKEFRKFRNRVAYFRLYFD